MINQIGQLKPESGVDQKKQVLPSAQTQTQDEIEYQQWNAPRCTLLESMHVKQ